MSKAKTPGRNALCPCGSGHKYKKCHGVARGTLPREDPRYTAYVLCNSDGTAALVNEHKQVLVTTNRNMALTVWRNWFQAPRYQPFATLGLTPERWILFQKDQPGHRLLATPEACEDAIGSLYRVMYPDGKTTNLKCKPSAALAATLLALQPPRASGAV